VKKPRPQSELFLNALRVAAQAGSDTAFVNALRGCLQSLARGESPCPVGRVHVDPTTRPEFARALAGLDAPDARDRLLDLVVEAAGEQHGADYLRLSFACDRFRRHDPACPLCRSKTPPSP
jgi:hypothetical protein